MTRRIHSQDSSSLPHMALLLAVLHRCGLAFRISSKPQEYTPRPETTPDASGAGVGDQLVGKLGALRRNGAQNVDGPGAADLETPDAEVFKPEPFHHAE